MNFLKQIDKELFLFLNGMNNDFFDAFFFLLTDKFTWIPFYAFLLIVVYKNAGKDFFKILIAVALLILITDQSTNLCKNYFQRLRPCHNNELASVIHLVQGKCGGTYGFVSAHATNSMALSFFLLLLFRKKLKWLLPVLLTYVFLVSYSRIYLGIHYPLDVFCGWILGIGIAFALFKIMVRFQLLSFSK